MVTVEDIEGVMRLQDQFSSALITATKNLQTFNDAIKPADQSVKKLEESSTSAFGKMAEVMGGIVGANLLGKIGGGLLDAAKGAVMAAANFEQTKIAFTTMLGSAQQADIFLKQMEDFAAKTPFEFPDLVVASRRLLAFGFEAKEIQPILRSVGDAAAGLGLGSAGIDRITLALGQMSAKGKVAGDDMRQLTEAGINGWKYLAESMGKSIAQVQKEASSGQIRAAEAIKIMLAGMSKDFGGMMEKQSATMLGQISTIKDTFGFILRDIGSALLPVLKDVVQHITDLAPAFQKGGAAAADFLLAIIEISGELLKMSKPLIDLGGFILKDAADNLKTLTGGMVDFETAIKHADMAGDALRLTWLSLQNLVLDLAIAMKRAEISMSDNILTAGAGNLIGQKLGFGGEEGKEELKLLEAQKNAIAARAQEVVDGAQKSAAATGVLTGKIKDHTNVQDVDAKAMKQAAKEAKELATAFSHAAKAWQREMEAETSKKIDAVGEASQNASVDMGLLADRIERVGGVSQLTNPQLKELVDQMAGAAAKGGDNPFGLETMAKALSEMALRQAAIPKIATELDNMARSTKEVNAAWGKMADTWNKVLFEDNQVMVGNMRNLASAVIDLGDAFGGALGEALKFGAGAFQVLANLNDEALQAKGTWEKVTIAIQGAADAYKSGSVLQGAMAGAQAGASFGLIGAGIGAVAGGLLGLLGGGEGRKVNDLRDKFIEAAGGLDALNKKAAEAGVTLNQLLNAKTIDAYNAAVNNLNGAIDAQAQKLALQNESQTALNDAVQRYGFTIDELGPKWKQQELDKMAAGLLQDYKLLTASGIDNNLVIDKMGESLSDYVNTAKKAGVDVPEAMRPMIELAIQNGELVDENGDAYKSAEEAGISYAQTMSEMFTTLLDKITKLVNALLGINDISVAPDIRIPNLPDINGGEGPMRQFAVGGFTEGGGMAMLHPNEAVVPLDRTTPFSSEFARTLASEVAAAMGGSGGSPTIHVYIGTQAVRDFHVREERAGMLYSG